MASDAQAGGAEKTAEGEEVWHVKVASGEVKMLTLEQLDDLFRLEIIDGDTRVWREGMGDWLPLSVMAGLDDDDDDGGEAAARPVATAPVPVAAPVPVPAPVAAPPAAAPASAAPSISVSSTSWPPGIAPASAPPSAPRPAPSSAPAPSAVVASRPAASASPGGASEEAAPRLTASWPPSTASAPPAAPSSPPAAPSAAPAPEVPELLAPARAPARGGRRTEQLIVGAAALLGLLVTLYRNDILRDLAGAVGSESAVVGLEETLGGPGFGTPRSIELLRAPSTVAPEPTAGSTASPRPTAPAARPAGPATPARKQGAQPAAAARSKAPDKPRATGAKPSKKPTKGSNKGVGKYDPLNPTL